MLDKELIQEIGKLSWKDFEKSLQNAKTEEEHREALIYRCATDLELFSEFFFPHYCTRAFNDFHKDYFKFCKYGERKIRRATAAPRGAAKSTHATLIKAIHDVCYGLEDFTVVLSSTTPLSNKKLKDIRMEVYSNVELGDFYGLRFPKKKAGESEFLLISNLGRTYFAAVGRGSEVRGIRYGSKRPTKFIFDDVEFSEEVYNEKSRQKTEDWFKEDVGKAGDTLTNIEFVGTVLHRDSLLSKLLKNPSYESRKYKSIISWSEREDLWEKWREIYRDINNDKRAIEAQAFFEKNRTEMLKGTKVLWPEKEDYLAHMIDMEEIGYRSFMKEKQNEPQGADETVFEKIHYYKEEADGFRIESNNLLVPWSQLECIAAMDPSTGKVKATGGKMGDFTSIPVGYVDYKKRVYVHHAYLKRAAPTKYIEEIFNLEEKFKIRKIAVETNLYRNLLLQNILDEKKRREAKSGKIIQLAFYEVEQTENKRERITRLEPKVNHGYMLFNRAMNVEAMNQLVDFPHHDHDDFPDSLEILWNTAHNVYKPAGMSLSAMSGR